MAATGTDGRRINKRFALPLPYGGDDSGQFGAVTGDLSDSTVSAGSDPNPLSCRVLSLSGGDRRREAPGGFEPPVEVLQTSSISRQRFTPKEVAIESPALCPSLAPRATDLTHDLAEIVTAWPTLPEPIKAGILAMVKAAAVTEGGR
jgi:hypothetical protein